MKKEASELKPGECLTLCSVSAGRLYTECRWVRCWRWRVLLPRPRLTSELSELDQKLPSCQTLVKIHTWKMSIIFPRQHGIFLNCLVWHGHGLPHLWQCCFWWWLQDTLNTRGQYWVNKNMAGKAWSDFLSEGMSEQELIKKTYFHCKHIYACRDPVELYLQHKVSERDSQTISINNRLDQMPIYNSVFKRYDMT